MLTETSSYASLRIPRFRRLWLAIIIFNIGHLVQVVASSWQVLELTGSPTWVSAMIAAPTLPLLFMSLHAGAAADLRNRRVLLVVSTSIMAAATIGMAVVTTLNVASPGVLVALGLVLGVGLAFFNPAWHAIVPALVPQSLLPGAVALNSASGGVATAVGPALGGLLVSSLGVGWSFVGAAAGYLVILVTVVRATGLEWESERDTIGVAIATGLRYLRFSDGYGGLLILGCAFGFSSAALRTLLPNLTSGVLDGSAGLYGLLLGSFGVGAIAGGFTRGQGKKLLGSRYVPRSILIFGATGVAVGWSPNIAIVVVSLAVAGLMWTWILSTLNGIFQVLTPDWVRGRAMSAFLLSVFGFLPLGALACGRLAEAVGASSSLILFSTATMLIGLISLRIPFPVLEAIQPPLIPEIEPAQTNEDSPQDRVMVTTEWTIAERDLEAFVEVLLDLRRLRLSTGAYAWDAYRSANDPMKVTEVFMVHSWEHHLKHLRRLDTRGIAIIQRADRFDVGGSQADELIAFDVDGFVSRPEKDQRGLESDSKWRKRDR